SWAGPITLGSNAAIFVSANGANVDTLNQGSQGSILPAAGFTATPGSLTKVGGGTLEMSGTSDNLYQGSTFLNEGTILANKVDVDSRPFRTLALGRLLLQNINNVAGFSRVYVGNETGGEDKDLLLYGANAGLDQIYSFE